MPAYFNVPPGVQHAESDANLGVVSATVTLPRQSSTDTHPPVWLTGLPALSQRMTRLLIEGDVDGTYALMARERRDKTAKNNHDHAVTVAIATAAARAGWNCWDFEAVMLDSPSKGGNHAKTINHRKGHREASKYLQRVWERAQKLVADTCISSRQDAIADLMPLRNKIAAHGWKGTAGNTAMRVLMAYWRAAYKAGGRKFTLSYREAAEMAGCTAATAYKAVKLRLNRWLRCLEIGSGEDASAWYLLDGSHERNTPRGAQPPPAQPHVSPVRKGEMDAGVIERLMSLDAFAHRGLGMSSLKVLAALSTRDGQTVKELIESANASSATVYRVVKVLTKHGLVAHVGEVWELTQEAQEAIYGAWDGWDEVADQEGTLGTGARRQALHRAQREAWLTITLPRLRERRMPDVIPVRGDEVDQRWRWGNEIIDPTTGEIISDMVIASDGRLMLVDEEPSYEELVRQYQLAQAA